jgi:glycerophosphoryl diester phosphodiesterase
MKERTGIRMFDFNDTIVNNAAGRPLICAHRGVSGGNIPCNTLAAFSAALAQGADVIELDVTESRDGQLFVFHPGKESAHLKSHKLISAMKADKVKKLRYVNQDNDETQFGVDRLCDILDFLKGKCYINVDKFWTDIPGISAEIRRVGVEKQVIVKTALKDKYLKPLKECAADFMFMPIVRDTDTVTDRLVKEGIRCVGAEILFEKETASVASEAYISSMHEKGMVLFVNAIVYNYKDVLAAGHNDDISVAGAPDDGWGWLLGKGFDIIQTDWCGMLRAYINRRTDSI